MKTFLAEKNVPGMTKEEIVNFLEKGTMILHLGTLDSTTGDPMIHPVWYYFAHDRFFFFTDKDASKLRNVKRESAVYFTIDIGRQNMYQESNQSSRFSATQEQANLQTS